MDDEKNAKRGTAVVVGTGGRAHAFVKAASLDPDLAVTACYAPSPVRREPFAEQYGLRSYVALDEMLEAEQPDLVHIVTWPNARLEPMRVVADHGVPACTVEKPVAVGVDDFTELRALEQSSVTRFAVSHQLRWHRDLVRVREAAQSGRLGDLLHVEMTAGMNVAGQGTHILDYGSSLVGDRPVTRVTGMAFGSGSLTDLHSSPDGLVALVEFEGHVAGSYVLGPVAPRTGGDPAVEWQHVRVAVSGTRGRAEYREFGSWWVDASGAREDGNCGDDTQRRRSNHEAQAAFHRALLDWATDDGPEVGTSLGRALAQWKVILAIYESTLARRPISLDEFEPSADLMSRLQIALEGS